MKRFELRARGVFDRETGEVLQRGDPGWTRYEEWLSSDPEANVPDPLPLAAAVARREEFDFAAAGRAREERALARLAKSNPTEALLRKAGLK